MSDFTNVFLLVLEGILILAALIVHQGKSNREEKTNAAGNAFSWALLLYTVLAVANLHSREREPSRFKIVEMKID